MVIASISQAGVHTSWQDLGRVQSAHHGYSEGGVMDRHAALWANRLLSSNSRRPVLEITMGMFALTFETACQISVTGADLAATINNSKIKPWRTFNINVGDEVKFTSPVSGLRAYLAIDAEIEFETVFGSASTVLRENLPGSLGKTLKVGDQINGRVTNSFNESRNVPSQFIPNYEKPLVLQLIPGYQFDQFSDESIDQLITNEYQIQTSSTRMAYLLQGEPITHSITSLASEGIAYGAVQIPPSGQPVILLNDRQTMGGYPKPGCISRLSGSQLAQRFAPTKVSFELTSAELARQSYQEFLSFFSD